MKKILSIILTIVAVASFSLFALGSGSGETKDTGKGKAEKTEKSDSNIGNFSIEIESCRLAKDYFGKDVVIVKYIFKNVSNEEPKSFTFAFDDNVFQNGVGLNKSYILDDSANYNSDNQSKEIQKGASLDVEVAYELNDTSTDIEVQIKELFSFKDDIIKKTFSIQ